jgi:hypothetical protein
VESAHGLAHAGSRRGGGEYQAIEGVEVLLIAGRSGVGKSTVGAEVSRQLIKAKTAHCLIEGDNLCATWPAPPEDPRREALTEANLTAVWANYAAAGYRRLIYTNTACVLEPAWIERAVGGKARFTGALLTATEDTALVRLQGREIGGGLDWHVRRSRLAAVWLDEQAAEWVSRVATDGRPAADIATELIGLTDWLNRPVGDIGLAPRS